MRDLLSRIAAETDRPPDPDRICRGTLLSRAQYLVDLEAWGYEDARRRPRGALTPREIERWTLAIGDEERPRIGVVTGRRQAGGASAAQGPDASRGDLLPAGRPEG
jgi:hypothetical protein